MPSLLLQDTTHRLLQQFKAYTDLASPSCYQCPFAHTHPVLTIPLRKRLYTKLLHVWTVAQHKSNVSARCCVYTGRTLATATTVEHGKPSEAIPVSTLTPEALQGPHIPAPASRLMHLGPKGLLPITSQTPSQTLHYRDQEIGQRGSYRIVLDTNVSTTSLPPRSGGQLLQNNAAVYAKSPRFKITRSSRSGTACFESLSSSNTCVRSSSACRKPHG